jgi:hypothetical protein
MTDLSTTTDGAPSVPTPPVTSDPQFDQYQQTVNQAVKNTLEERRPDLIANAVGGLSGFHKKATAEKVIGSVDTKDQPDILTTAIDNLPASEQKATVKKSYLALSPQDQEDLASTGLGSPDAKTRQKIWYVVVGTMAAALFVFGTMAFVLILRGDAAEAPLALATAALGGLVGLVATSPGATSRTTR